jgi:hypothetical protein
MRIKQIIRVIITVNNKLDNSFLKDNLGSNISSILDKIISKRQGTNIICIIDENNKQDENLKQIRIKGKTRKYKIKNNKSNF